MKTQSFSVYKKPVKNTNPFKEVTSFDVYRVVISDKYKPVTERLRLANGSIAKGIKGTEFDYATFSGTFTKRSDDCLKEYSGLTCIDLDNLHNISEVKSQILKDFLPELMFVSPSGNGLKVVYRIDLSKGTSIEYFKALQTYFRQRLSIDIDPSGKDISRACFLPYDPDCHYSDAPTLLDSTFLDTFQEPLTEIQKDEGVQPTGIDEVYRRLKLWVEKKVVFAKGSRNRYITKLVGALNRYGIPQNVVLTKLRAFEEEDFTQQEIEATVKSIYRNSKLFNTKRFEYNTSVKSTEPKKEIEPTPLLPIDGLPDSLKNLIEECSRVYGTHRDFWAGSFLATTAIAIGQSHQLQGKYKNGPVLWLALIAPSGSGKTEPLNFAFKPLHRIDSEAIKKHEELLKEYETIKAMSKTDRAELGINQLPDMPVCVQYILSDATPEAVIQANKNNSRGINIVRDELHGWLLDFGRYSKSGEVQNWLSAWSQDPMTVNRKGSGPIKNEHPLINITGGMQPAIITELAKDNRADNGFMARFCFVFPDEAVRPQYRSIEVSEELKNQYSEYITHLLDLTGHCDKVHLSTGAQSIYESFVNENTRISNIEKTDYLKALYAKLDVISLRLALIIHFSKWACTGIDEPNITPETMQAGIAITEYFRATGKKVHNQLTAGDKGLNPKVVAAYLREKGASQNKIAAVLNVSQSYVSQILKS